MYMHLGRTLCPLRMKEARRNDNGFVGVLRDLHMEPGESPRPTALSSIAE